MKRRRNKSVADNKPVVTTVEKTLVTVNLTCLCIKCGQYLYPGDEAYEYMFRDSEGGRVRTFVNHVDCDDKDIMPLYRQK